MVTILTGRAGSGRSAYIFDKIKQAAAHGIEGQILLVPEQRSFVTERELCARCGPDISLSAQVYSFKSLSRELFTRDGGLAKIRVDESGRLLLVRAAAQTVDEELILFRGCAKKPALLAKIASCIAEFKTCGLLPALLAAGFDAEQTGPLPVFHQKIRDLSYIYEAYDALLTANIGDPADDMTALAELILTSDFFDGKRVYIDGFNGFTAAELSVIANLSAKAAEVTVSLCLDPSQPDSDAFAHVSQTYNDLLTLCSPCQTLDLGASRRYINPASDLAYIERALFDYFTPPKTAPRDASVEVCAASSAYAECELAAAKILSLARAGVRYREIALCARNFADYAPILEAVFKRYNIPAFLDRREPATSLSPVLSVIAILRAAAYGRRNEDMLRLLKTGFTPLARAEADELENYALMWKISGNAWAAPFSAHPDGYGREFDDNAQARLSRLNDLRARFVAPLLTFEAAAKKSPTVEGISRALYAYLEQTGFHRLTIARAAALEAEGKLRGAAVYRQVTALICGCLDQLVLILGNAETDLREYSRLFEIVISGKDIGSIPTALDCVTAGEAGRMRFDHPRHLLVLGVCDGIFPPGADEPGLFSLPERAEISRLSGRRLPPAESERDAFEKAVIYQTLSAPSEGLYLSFPASLPDGSAAQPSYIISRLRALLPELEIASRGEEEARVCAPLPCAELAASVYADGARNPLCRAAAEALDRLGLQSDLLSRAKLAARAARGPLDPDCAGKLYRDRPILTASRVEKFSACPFAYFAQYGLKARPRRPAELAAADVGTFIHYVLEHTAADVAALPLDDPWGKISPSQVRELAEKNANEYVETRLGGRDALPARTAYSVRRLTEHSAALLENIAGEFKQSDFRPLFFERALGSGDNPAEFLTPGGSVRLSGVVDRVDVWERDGKKYIRIVDYKTGDKKLDWTDVQNGLSVQLPLYLFALADAFEAIPAGMMYIPTFQKNVTMDCVYTDSDAQKRVAQTVRRSGAILKEEGIAEAMDKTGALYIPTTRGKPDYLIPEEFDRLRGHVAQLLDNVSREVLSGEIECRPYLKGKNSICEYCDFRAICQFDSTRQCDRLRELEKTTAERFFGRAGKEG